MVINYAAFQFARTWALGREKPQALDRMIKKLVKFLASGSATTKEKQKYILDSKCLQVSVWNDGDIHLYNEKTPSGYTYSQVLAQCCKGEGHEFALWLCTHAYFANGPYGLYGTIKFWRSHNAQFDTKQALIVAQEHNQEALVKFLSMPWWSKEEFQLEYGTQRDVILSSIPVESKHIGWVKAFFDRAIILEQIPSQCHLIAIGIIAQGCQPDDLRKVLDVGEQAKALAQAEGYFDTDFNYDFMKSHIHHTGYENEHPLLQILPFYDYMNAFKLGKIHNYLTVEHHTSLLKYCLHNVGGWTAETEIEVVQIAAYYNHTDILEMFVLNPTFGGFLTDHATR